MSGSALICANLRRLFPPLPMSAVSSVFLGVLCGEWFCLSISAILAVLAFLAIVLSVQYVLFHGNLYFSIFSAIYRASSMFQSRAFYPPRLAIPSCRRRESLLSQPSAAARDRLRCSQGLSIHLESREIRFAAYQGPGFSWAVKLPLTLVIPCMTTTA